MTFPGSHNAQQAGSRAGPLPGLYAGHRIQLAVFVASMAAILASRDSQVAGLRCGAGFTRSQGKALPSPAGPPTWRPCWNRALSLHHTGTETGEPQAGVCGPSWVPSSRGPSLENTHSLIRGLRKRVRLGGQETTGSVCVHLTFGWFRKVQIQLSCYPDRDQKLVLSPRPGSPGRRNGVSLVATRPHVHLRAPMGSLSHRGGLEEDLLLPKTFHRFLLSMVESLHIVFEPGPVLTLPFSLQLQKLRSGK